MPTRHQRIPVTNDPELAEALARVARFYGDAPAARIVRDLAIKGAEALEQAESERREAIENLIVFSTQRTDLIDWELLESDHDAAWGW